MLSGPADFRRTRSQNKGPCDFKTTQEEDFFSMNTGTESPVTDSDMWWHYTTGDALRNGNMASSSLAAKGYRSVRPNLQDKKSPTPSLSSIAMLEELRTCGVDSEGGSETPSPTPCQLSSSTDNMAIDIPTSSTVNTVDRPKDWYKNMFKQIHVVHKPEFEYSSSHMVTQPTIKDEKHSPTNNVQAHPAPKSSTYRPITKSISDNGTCGFRTSSSSSLPTSSSAQSMSHNRIHQSGSSTPDINQWGPPDRKVDTRKYRAEPRSIFDYEPGKSSILDQEKALY
ncbi:hypothetical protein QTP86_006222 [Hemibagrus guttatus]|nr:hypothetical protein QTP86_006222 [Hemibagrus guttatus]